MTTQTVGTLRREGAKRAVRHERRYDASVEEVWAALTEPEQVRNWLAEMTLDPRAGGEVTFTWEGGHGDHGVVRVFDPPHVFEYTWEQGAQSIVRFELSADGDGSLLVLEHTHVRPESAVGIGAGWHLHLDAMEALLAGSPQTPAEWNARHADLAPVYERQAEAL